MSQLQIRNTLLTQVVATLTPLVGVNIAFVRAFYLVMMSVGLCRCQCS